MDGSGRNRELIDFGRKVYGTDDKNERGRGEC